MAQKDEKSTSAIAIRARQLRRNQTEVERTLWHELRSRRLGGAKFRRQMPIGPYIVDFACPACQLVIELDGGQHAGQAEYDGERSRILADHGYRVVRFWNHEVNENLDGVLATIKRMLDRQHESPSPSPLPQGGEG